MISCIMLLRIMTRIARAFPISRVLGVVCVLWAVVFWFDEIRGLFVSSSRSEAAVVVTEDAPVNPAGKVLLFFGSFPKSEHLWFLSSIWPKVLSRSAFLQSADILVYVGGEWTKNDAKNWHRMMGRLPVRNKRLIHDHRNPGYQAGAMRVVAAALENGW